MMVRVKEVILVHVVDHLLEHGPFQHLAEDGEDCNRPIIFCFKLAPFTFVYWDNFCYFPLSWELVLLDRQVDNMTN